jgi:16S rRNA (guanine527-N7)-methyltransferase
MSLVCSSGLLASALGLSETRDAEVMARLVRYTELLDRWSSVQRLVGWKKASLLATEGLADAWALVGLIDRHPNEWLLDLGSGAGLPGLILALARPDREVHLVEPRRKRVSFLREVCRDLELKQVRVHHARESEVRAEFEGRTGPLLFARAFLPPEELLIRASEWSSSGCVLSVQVGRRTIAANWSLSEIVDGRPKGTKEHQLWLPTS